MGAVRQVVFQDDFSRLQNDLEGLAGCGGNQDDTSRPGDRLEEGTSSTVGMMTFRPAVESPLLGAERLAGLLSEAEALLRETAITAAMATAAANETAPVLDGVAADASGDTLASTSAVPDIAVHSLASADALLDAVDGFLLVAPRPQGNPPGGGLADSLLVSPSSLGASSGVAPALPGSSVHVQSSPTASVATRLLPEPSQWVSDARHWDGGDLGAQLEEICRELDEVVGLSTARGRELEPPQPVGSSSVGIPWPLPIPL